MPCAKYRHSSYSHVVNIKKSMKSKFCTFTVDKIVRKASNEHQVIDFKGKISMLKNVADLDAKGQLGSNKFCTQSVDKIVCKRKIRSQVP